MKYLLALSLAANVGLAAVLGYYLSHRAAKTAAVPTAAVMPSPNAPTKVESRDADGVKGDSSLGAGSYATRVMSNPEVIATRMKRDGYPSVVISQAVLSAIKWRDRAERNRIVGAEKLNAHRRALPLTPAQEKEIAALDAREWDELQRLTDVDSFLAEENAKAPGRRSISADKFAQVQKLEKEYQELARSPALQSGDGTLVTPAVKKKLDSEFETDLAKVLSPQELQNYMRYESRLAQKVQGNLAKLDITEAQYLSIVDSLLAVDRQLKDRAGDSTSKSDTEGTICTAYRNALGDADFLQVAPKINSTIASADKVYEKIGLSITQRADLFAEVERGIARAAALPAQEQSTAAKKLYSDIVQRAGLTPPQIELFDQTQLGKMLYFKSSGG